MDSFKKESRKKRLDQYYCQTLNILATPTYSSTQTQSEDGDQDGDFEESDDEARVKK